MKKQQVSKKMSFYDFALKSYCKAGGPLYCHFKDYINLLKSEGTEITDEIILHDAEYRLQVAQDWMGVLDKQYEADTYNYKMLNAKACKRVINEYNKRHS